MVGVELVNFGVHFDNCGSLHDPVPGLIFSMGIYDELVQEGLGINLVFDEQKNIIEVLSEGQLLVTVSLACWISAFFAA